MNDTPIPGSAEWLKARIAEHKAAQEQSMAQANAHAGAMQAYERLLNEMAKVESPPA
jgi:hypothetical protein